jgi:hypothetical protein
MPTRVSITACLIALLALLGLATSSGAAVAHEGDVALAAALSGAEEVPGPGDPQGRGHATATLHVAAGLLCYDLAVAQLTARPVAAHIHRGKVGEAGPVVVGLLTPPTDTSSGSACREVEPGLLRAIAADPAGYYVNVHTAAFPGGAVRGQLRSAGEDGPPGPVVGTPTRPVRPILECVRDNGDGGFTARFGYESDNPTPVRLPIGPANRFTPGPDDRAQASVFEPGRLPRERAFSVNFAGDALTWTLLGPDGQAYSATASRGGPPCDR